MKFSEIGIPFPLFDADSDDADGYMGVRRCCLCSSEGHCFELGIGCAVMIACPNCQTENGLDADDRDAVTCRNCDAKIEFPSVADDEEVAVCYDCLRAGRAAITSDTELGMISWEQAWEGLTHGAPGLDRDDFDLEQGEDDWVKARLPEMTMYEILRTPNYITIQGEKWQFCCKSPMTFIGQWERRRFEEESESGDGKALFDSIVQDPVPGLWEDQLHDITGIYVFRCEKCGRKTGCWDIA